MGCLPAILFIILLPSWPPVCFIQSLSALPQLSSPDLQPQSILFHSLLFPSLPFSSLPLSVCILDVRNWWDTRFMHVSIDWSPPCRTHDYQPCFVASATDISISSPSSTPHIQSMTLELRDRGICRGDLPRFAPATPTTPQRDQSANASLNDASTSQRRAASHNRVRPTHRHSRTHAKNKKKHRKNEKRNQKEKKKKKKRHQANIRTRTQNEKNQERRLCMDCGSQAQVNPWPVQAEPGTSGQCMPSRQGNTATRDRARRRDRG